MAEKRRNVLNQMTDAVRAEMQQMIVDARFATLGWLEPNSGHPMVSRVGLATLEDNTPLLFISSLAAHTGALERDPRCALLIGEPGKGDPLAHPRLSLKCEAVPVADAEVATAKARYLAAHPKAQLYIDLGDFRFVRLTVLGGSFNGGFGRAYHVLPSDVLS